MTNEEMIKRINEIDKEREQLKQEKRKYLRELETVKLKNKYKEHKKCTVISGYAGSRKIYFSKIYNKSFTSR